MDPKQDRGTCLIFLGLVDSLERSIDMLKKTLILLLLLVAPLTADPLAEVWAHTSGEYEAVCMQTYNLALERLKGLEPLTARDAQGRARLAGDTRPLAIIMDLDETVVDNSPFQVFLATTKTPFKYSLWQEWVRYQGSNPGAQHAVPGAVAFIKEVQAMGITPIFISNRETKVHDSTVAVLTNLGLDTTDLDQRLILRRPDEREQATEYARRQGIPLESEAGKALIEGEGNKEYRRRVVAKDYLVVAYFGDVLGDFFAYVQQDPNQYTKERRSAAQNFSDRWGRNWFILPNPLYGPWAPAHFPTSMSSQVTDYGFEIWLRARR